MKVGTLHVGTMTGKGRELAEVIVERKVDIQCIQEKKWKGTTQEHRICLHIILLWEQLGGEAGVIPKEDYTGRVLDGKRVSDRMIYMKLDIEGVMVTVISAFAHTLGAWWKRIQVQDRSGCSGGKNIRGGESGDRGSLQWTCWRRTQRR